MNSVFWNDIIFAMIGLLVFIIGTIIGVVISKYMVG